MLFFSAGILEIILEENLAKFLVKAVEKFFEESSYIYLVDFSENLPGESLNNFLEEFLEKYLEKFLGEFLLEIPTGVYVWNFP